MEPLAQTLARNAREFELKPAVIDGPTTLTHGELFGRVCTVVAALRGCSRRRALIVLPNGRDLIVAHYAALIAGTEGMLLDARLPGEELVALVGRFQPEIVITSRSDMGLLTGAFEVARTVNRIVLLSEEVSAIDAADDGAGTVTHVAWSERVPPGRFVDSSDLDSVALVLCTTGTTGGRKYVGLTQRNVLAAARNINEFMGIGEWAREVCPLPLHRSFGLARARCLALVGGTLIISPPRGDRAVALLRQQQANGLSGVPAFFRMLIKTFGPRLARYFGSLKYIEIGSAPMTYEDKLFLLDTAPHARICMHYGLTEASRSAFIEFRSERAKLDTIGKPAPHVELRVVSDDGSPCAPDEVGEIVVRGEHVCAGYWNDPELTAARLRDGWLRTNDCGSAGPDGYFRLAGRMDDIMNVGGVKVSPEKIESVVRDIPGVVDCAAVGAKDPMGVYGEVPFLYVVSDSRSLSVQMVKSYCAQRLLPEEVPHEVVFIESIPRTDTGKVQRGRLHTCGA